MLPISIQREIDDLVLRFNAANPTNSIPTEAALAVVDVESDGKPYSVVGGVKRPTILFEPHLLFRRLSGAARDEAVAARLASPKRNKKLYGKTQADRWSQIAAAQDLLRRHGLDPGIAIECTSFGVGQVLGANWKDLGFANVTEFFDLVNRDIAGQVEVMLRFIVVNDLDDELRDGRWAAFARGYNGPAYKTNSYDSRMAAAAKLYGGDDKAADGMLRMGSRGARVREMQALLVRAGYQVKVDGDFGPSTKAALKQFQNANKISVDGVYGPETESALGKFRQGAADKPGKQTVAENGGVINGVGGAIAGAITADKIDKAKDAVDGAIPQLQQYEGLSQWVGYGITALTLIAAGLAVAALAYAGWSWWNSTRTKEA